MTLLQPTDVIPFPGEPRSDQSLAQLGDARARLLAGPASPTQAESYGHHLMRLGPLDLNRAPSSVLLGLIRESGLVGRGGGEFPLVAKLDAAVNAGGTPIVVVNASEGEPASGKDETLLRCRPHLVLDGAELVTRAIGAKEVVLYVHRGRSDVTRILDDAIRERRGGDERLISFRVVEGPGRYVSGEASAVVSFLERGVALPRTKSVPLAVAGVAGHPTIVSNTETYAHVALIGRFGPRWFRDAGSAATPGSTLVTVAGSVSHPGSVIEVLRPIALARALAPHVVARPRAVLLGGYAGVWIDGELAGGALLDRSWLRRVGAPLGCGVIAVLGRGSCGLAETVRLLDWMVDESAGQCGPCVSGLPAIADLLHGLVDGRASSRDVLGLGHLAMDIRGRGACGHPTGAANLIESALDVFAPEVREHVRGARCTALGYGLPLPASKR